LPASARSALKQWPLAVKIVRATRSGGQDVASGPLTTAGGSDTKGTVMKPILIALLTLALLSIASSQTTKPSEAERTKNDLMQLERDIGKANINSDYAFFERVEAEEFIFTDAGGGVTTKKQDLEGLKQPRLPSESLIAYDVDEMNVLLYDKMAIVTGRVTTKRMVTGTEVVSKSRFTDVFVWRQERWQLVAGHSSRIRQ
jgi:hypothetical protein